LHYAPFFFLRVYSTNYFLQDGYLFQGNYHAKANKESNHCNQGNFDYGIQRVAADCETEIASLK